VVPPGKCGLQFPNTKNFASQKNPDRHQNLTTFSLDHAHPSTKFRQNSFVTVWEIQLTETDCAKTQSPSLFCGGTCNTDVNRAYIGAINFCSSIHASKVK